MKCVRVDGCPDGWLAVGYDDEKFEAAEYPYVQDLWNNHNDAELILIDVPIGLREDDCTPRPCDVAAIECSGFPRSSSVFPTPINGVFEEEDYQEAREIQEDRTDNSLRAQTWGISGKIAELNEFMLANDDEVDGVIREAHPEICYWALNGGVSTQYSKTAVPIAAF